jgi:hypothetical protein
MSSTFEKAKEFAHQAAEIKVAAEEAVKAAQEKAAAPDPRTAITGELVRHE